MRYNWKILYAPVKWLGSLIFVILIPIAMYIPTCYDFINVSVIYMPFIGIVLFTDFCLLDKKSNAEEIVFLSNRKPVLSFIQRYLISIAILLVYVILANVVYRMLQQFQDEVMVEPISMLEYILIVVGGCLYIGAISMTISTILSNVYIGYAFSISFWLYWNINCETEMIMNPFPFIANPTFFEKPLFIIYGFAFGLILFNCFLSRKSPFYLQDKVRRLLIK